MRLEWSPLNLHSLCNAKDASSQTLLRDRTLQRLRTSMMNHRAPRDAWLCEPNLHESNVFEWNHGDCPPTHFTDFRNWINATVPPLCTHHTPGPCSAPERTSSTRNCRPNSRATVHLGPEKLKVHAAIHCYDDCN